LSRSPHQVRIGSITWQLNRGIPREVVVERVKTSVQILKRHYDQPTKREELEERRRHHLDRSTSTVIREFSAPKKQLGEKTWLPFICLVFGTCDTAIEIHIGRGSTCRC
jgi:hypothetical protein